jgi:hypothetical protein
MHLVAILALLLVTAVAGERLLDAPYGSRRRVTEWWVAGAVVHDGLLLPAYMIVDAAVLALWRRHPGRVAWINHVRIPGGICLVLLLVYASEILRLNGDQFAYSTGRSDQPYLAHWLFLTALLFGLSGLSYLVRTARSGRAGRRRADFG